jgi:GT2 family glycosyltransferase
VTNQAIDLEPTPTVLVVIVSYNAGIHLQRCVDCLERQSFTDWRAIVWDNASSDGAAANLVAADRIRVVLHDQNLGFAAANNRAAALSPSRYIATLNPDAFPEPNWLEELVRAAELSGADSVASLQLCDDAPNLLDGAGDCMSIAGIAWRGGYLRPRSCVGQNVMSVFSACAAAALYSRSAFEAVGGFEERFFCYYEDVDLGFRLRLANGRCILAPDAIVRHVGSASSSQVSGFAEFYGTRNRAWTFMRDMPLLYLPIALPLHILVIVYVVLRSTSPALRDARMKGLFAAWKGRGPWLRARKRTPLWMSTRPFAISPLAIHLRAPHLFVEPARRGRLVPMNFD